MFAGAFEHLTWPQAFMIVCVALCLLGFLWKMFDSIG